MLPTQLNKAFDTAFDLLKRAVVLLKERNAQQVKTSLEEFRLAINEILQNFAVALKQASLEQLSSSQLQLLAKCQIDLVAAWWKIFADKNEFNYQKWLDDASINLWLMAKKDLTTKDRRDLADIFSRELQHTAMIVQVKNNNFYTKCTRDACDVLEKIPEKERTQQDWITLFGLHFTLGKIEDENPIIADIHYESCQLSLQHAGEFSGYLFTHAALAVARTRVYFELREDDQALASAERALSLIRNPKASAASMETDVIALQGHTYFSKKNSAKGINCYIQVFDRCSVSANQDGRKPIDDVFKFSQSCWFLEKHDFKYQLVEFIYKIFIGEATKAKFNELVDELIVTARQDGIRDLIVQFNIAIDAARINVKEKRNALIVKGEFGKALNDPDIIARQKELRDRISSTNDSIFDVFLRHAAQKSKESEARMQQLADENEKSKTRIQELEAQAKQSKDQIKTLETEVRKLQSGQTSIIKRLEELEKKPQQNSNPYSFLPAPASPAPLPTMQPHYKYNPTPTQRR